MKAFRKKGKSKKSGLTSTSPRGVSAAAATATTSEESTEDAVLPTPTTAAPTLSEAEESVTEEIEEGSLTKIEEVKEEEEAAEAVEELAGEEDTEEDTEKAEGKSTVNERTPLLVNTKVSFADENEEFEDVEAGGGAGGGAEGGGGGAEGGGSPKTKFRKAARRATQLSELIKSLRTPESSPFVQMQEAGLAHSAIAAGNSSAIGSSFIGSSFIGGGGSSRGSFLTQEEDRVALKAVSYDSNNHISVLFQMHGSVWPSVLPFCLINVLLTYAVALAKRHGFDITFPPTGHSFMSMLVSFLIVTRASIVYNRFMEARAYLSTCYRACRELIQMMAVLTMQDMGPGAKQWRQDVAFRTILLLRVTIAAIDFQSSNVNTWEVLPPSGGHDSDLDLLLNSNDDKSLQYHSKIVNTRIMKWAHGIRTLSDENFRAPIVLAYNLRSEIMKQRNGKFLTKKMFGDDLMHVNEELKLLSFVSELVTAFHGLKKLITTPFPFPLVQMARTFLFFWIFTLPLALIRNIDQPVQVMLIVFFMTYGFIGLEYVSMEMDDPFGDDPNDFDDVGMAQMVFEDIYITIFKTDGPESAEELRSKISARTKVCALDNYRKDLSEEIQGKEGSVVVVPPPMSPISE